MTLRESISVRGATEDDLDRVAAVWHRSASAMDAAAAPMPTRGELRARIDDELQAGWALFLAEQGQQVVGMIALKPHDAVLDQLFVLPDKQSSGIGTMLIDVAKQVMPAGFSLRMAEDNARAARFYQRSGLNMVRKGLHPMSGRPVCYYRWEGS
jgi:ribosomal protein S18 acetylase RimI-like enzyme